MDPSYDPSCSGGGGLPSTSLGLLQHGGQDLGTDDDDSDSKNSQSYKVDLSNIYYVVMDK